MELAAESNGAVGQGGIMRQHPNGSSMPVLNPNKFVVKRLKRAPHQKKSTGVTVDSPTSSSQQLHNMEDSLQ